MFSFEIGIGLYYRIVLSIFESCTNVMEGEGRYGIEKECCTECVHMVKADNEKNREVSENRWKAVRIFVKCVLL